MKYPLSTLSIIFNLLHTNTNQDLDKSIHLILLLSRLSSRLLNRIFNLLLVMRKLYCLQRGTDPSPFLTTYDSFPTTVYYKTSSASTDSPIQPVLLPEIPSSPHNIALDSSPKSNTLDNTISPQEISMLLLLPLTQTRPKELIRLVPRYMENKCTSLVLSSLHHLFANFIANSTLPIE